MENTKPNAHVLSAENVLSVLMHNGQAYRSAIFEHGLNTGHMPSQRHAALFLAIVAERATTPDGSLHDTVLLDMVKGHVDAAWLIDLHVGYDRLTDAAFERDLAIVMKHGEVNAVKRELLTTASQLTPETFEVGLSNALNTLATAGKSVRIDNEYASQNGADFEKFMAQAPQLGMRTGLGWFDEDMLCRVYPERVMYIGGAYKTGKTRLGLNVGLGNLMSEPDARGAIYSREVPRAAVIAQIVAMLAVAWLRARGIENEIVYGGSISGNISAEKLLKARNAYKTWHEWQVNAIDYGIRTYKAFGDRLTIYDSARENGGLYDLASFERLFKRNLSMQNADWHLADYAQLFAANGSSEVERSDTRALTFQRCALTDKKMLIVLAQRNEESIRGGDSYSAGIRGGGQYSAAADYMVLTSYKVENPDDKDTFPVQMKFSKWGETGRTNMTIHPASGLLFDASWIEGTKD